MCPELENYISRYYDDWLRYSRRWCSMCGIPREAYDLFADVLESLCYRPEAQVLDMLAREEAGDRNLFFYIRKAIRLEIYNYRARRYRATCSTDKLMCLLQERPEDNDAADELFNQFREVEAHLRADDYVDPRLIYNGKGSVSRFVTHVKRLQSIRPEVRYAVGPRSGRRSFNRYSSAVAFLQNTPPRKNRAANANNTF